jgi:hypothetical protein
MRTLLRLVVAVGLTTGAACQTTHHNAYADLVNRPMPASDAQRDHECQWIRSEEARQQTLGQVGASMQQSPQMAMAYQGMTRQNISYLQSRYAQIQCDVFRVAPTAPVLNMPPAQQQPSSSMTVEECFKKCRDLTSQTEAQCFDACRR